MLFSNFIKDSLLGRNNIVFNYYQNDININIDNILRAATANSFIRQYFENGEKTLPLLLNPEEAAQYIENNFLFGYKKHTLSFEFDMRYLLPNNRAIHTVSGFFLGLLIENCLNSNDSLSIVLPEYFPFSYLWFLTFLYHDYGYCVAEKKDSPIPVPKSAPIPSDIYSKCSSRSIEPFIREHRALRQVKTKLGITLSPFSTHPSFSHVSHSNNKENLKPISTLLHELTRRSSITARQSELQFNTGARIHGHQYSSTVVTRYFNYCINERKQLDHGIIGGYLFYDRIIKNYLLAYLSAQQETGYPVSLSDFYFRNRHFSENQLPVFSYIADCILVHNIWKQAENTHELYERYNLNIALGDAYKTITFSDNPLLYILAVADTLEPMKAYAATSPEVISASIHFDYLPGTRTLTVSSSNSAVDISVLHKKAKALEEWTSAQCSELKNATFNLYLN